MNSIKTAPEQLWTFVSGSSRVVSSDALACLWTVCATSVRKALLMFCELPEPPANVTYGVVEELSPDDSKPTQSPSTLGDRTSPWTPYVLTGAAIKLQTKDLALPAMQYTEKLLAAAAKTNVMKRVVGEPGCGKTTQAPQILARAAKNSSHGWTMAQVWQCHPYVTGAQSAYHRLKAATEDQCKSSCVSLYIGKQVETKRTWEVVAIATSKVALQRMSTLKEAGLQARTNGHPLPHLMIDEADHEDAWMALLVWVGRTLHRMGLVQLWLISATLDEDVTSIVVVGVIMDHWSPWTPQSRAPGSPWRPEHNPDLLFRTEKRLR